MCGDIVLNWRRKIFKTYTFVREGKSKVWDKFSQTESVGRRKTVKEVQTGEDLERDRVKKKPPI